MFFKPFWVLCLICKQVYKLELPRKIKIYNVFHVLLLKQDTTRKRSIDKNITELDANKNSGKYKIEVL